MLCTKIVLNVRNNFCTQNDLPRIGIFMYWTCNSMHNQSSYCGLVDARIKASDEDSSVKIVLFIEIKISEYKLNNLRNYKWYTILGKCLDIQICRVGNNISICLLPRYFSYWHFISIPRQFMRVLISSWLCTRFTIGSPPLLHTSGEMLQVGR